VAQLLSWRSRFFELRFTPGHTAESQKGSALAPPAYIPTAEAGGFTPGFGNRISFEKGRF
jgi:hypothetical protein